MTKKILIDASHAEETRVVVLDGNRLEDFDVETSTRKQIKGNIYLAKVIRVEPSLQAAFVEYGGNRHGFLAFGEIHPDYYQIPVADRQRLLAMQAEEDEEEEAQAAEAEPESASEAGTEAIAEIEAGTATEADVLPEELASPAAQALAITPIAIIAAAPPEQDGSEQDGAEQDEAEQETPEPFAEFTAPLPTLADEPLAHEHSTHAQAGAEAEPENTAENSETFEEAPEAPAPESLGGDGDDAAEARERRQRQRFLRNYKIQDVIHRRQIMLIQVVKEERGNKGAALTTYLSLAGRFSVLMPNSPSGGGVSRKITSVADRRRLKEAMAELDVPEGMGLIVRTAGANRPKPEITRDCEYLLRLWDDIRDRTLESTAPALIYEEASLIKRTIRDVYTRDVEDVLVDGEEGYQAARDFMRMLMPANARKVQLWGEGQPLFAKYQVEAQLDAMLHPTVQLRSGGYIVINQTEALVAIDVNSGRSTRERSIEDTALRTNLEAAEEVARQVRMRDLAGLIVIDFIDMESRKNNAAVERKMKDALKNDRARIQVGSISHFGLMEMSRQRLRPSLAEAALITCPHCAGMGHVRSPESAALHILRAIEDEGAKFRAAEIMVALPAEIGLYLFNHKRDRLSAIEARYMMRVLFSNDPTLTGSNFRIEKLKPQTSQMPAPTAYYAAPALSAATAAEPVEAEDEADSDVVDEAGTRSTTETAEEGERKPRRRRRRGKRRFEPGETGGDASADANGDAEDDESADNAGAGHAGDGQKPDTALQNAGADDQTSEIDLVMAAELGKPFEGEDGTEPPARRRRTRGGRRRGKAASMADTPTDGETAEARPQMQPEQRAPLREQPQAEPVYADIADIFEAAERAEDAARQARDAARREAAAKAEMAAEAAAPMETQTMVAEHAATEPALTETVAADVASETAEPLVKPIVISAEAPVEQKKRGWWRR